VPSGIAILFLVVGGMSPWLELAQGRGVHALEVLHKAHGGRVWTYGIVESQAPWITYEAGLDTTFLQARSELEDLAQRNPLAPVLSRCQGPESTGCDHSYAVVTAASLLADLSR
jgi:hypothetical protein